MTDNVLMGMLNPTHLLLRAPEKSILPVGFVSYRTVHNITGCHVFRPLQVHMG